MGSSSSGLRYVSLAGGLLSAAIFLSLVVVLPNAVHAADFTIVGGIVQRASGPIVTLEHGSYNIAQATIKDGDGRVLAISDISPGRKVDLYLSKGKVTAVFVYPTVMLE